MTCSYCQQMRQRIMTRFRIKRFRPRRDPRKAAVAQPIALFVTLNTEPDRSPLLQMKTAGTSEAPAFPPQQDKSSGRPQLSRHRNV
jgi:hypothetical protein